MTRVTQNRYEIGHTVPTLEYLSRLQRVGINVGFVLNGSAFSPNDMGPSDFSLFAWATAAVHAIVRQYNIEPSPELTLQVILKTFRASQTEGPEHAHPQLNDFFVGRAS